MALCRFRAGLVTATLLSFLALPAFGQAPLSTHHERTLDLLAASPPAALLSPQEAVPARKSVGLAAVYSLLLPGMGELYAGGFSSGKYFLAAEGLLWLTYAAFDIHGNALRNDARTFARVHSGAAVAGKNDQFFVDLGNFASIAEYNDKKMRDRRSDLVYDPGAGYNWAWDTDPNRATFRDQRIRSENVFNNRKFVVTAVLVNHIASAINAARVAISHNKEVDGALGDLHFEASVLGGWLHPHGVCLTVTRTI